MKRYVFDLDNTLIYTNSLNNDSYNYALSQLGLSTINDCIRITRSDVFRWFPKLSDIQKKQIIELKKKYFISNLEKTTPNKFLLRKLQCRNAEFCMLWTSAEKTRAYAILEHYKISNEFKWLLFSNKLNIKQDVKKMCELFECNNEELTIFEDDQKVIQSLQRLKFNVVYVDSIDYLKE